MEIQSPCGLITVVNEPTYSFNSTDNFRSYSIEVQLVDDSISSIHGVTLNGDGVVIVGADGGYSSVHERSALVVDSRLFLAVGNQVACLSLELPHRVLWSLRVDAATCFGIHWEDQHGALISHGELEISRLSTDGDLIWQASGTDIFSEGLRLLPHYVEAIDFNGSVYQFDYMTGQLLGP